MTIAILGGAGNMGCWLTRHFAGQNRSLVISDPQTPDLGKLLPSCDIRVTSDNKTAVNNAEVVVVSVPMNKTAAVIREVVPHMKRKSILCEISSLKMNLVDALEESTNHDIRPLSIHPMFGPGAQSLHKKILLIPIIDSENEQEVVKSLFPNAAIITVEADRHDQIMALTLSLPYFMNMILASVLAKEDVQVLKQIGGTTFEIQTVLTGSIMAQSTDLHYHLHRLNQYAMDTLTSLPSRIESLLEPLIQWDQEGFQESYERIKTALERSMDSARAYHDMYHILDFMEQHKASEGKR
ncbi:MAG: prephenate dehydrogenase/arogenate dehydrogenase family protein [Candidatus Thorarchaeota archaeon]|nr:prephenate dehydrogenase/arogenate dehydrogenase family protein [Candidatus Thorarchaeota archaeon]